MSGRTKNSVRNISAGIINKIILILLPFAVRTILVYQLGEEYLGLGSLFSSILMVLNLSELGFGSALVYSMYKPIAQEDTLLINSILEYHKKIYKYVGTIFLVLGLIVLPFIPYLIKGDCPTDINIYVLYLIYLLNTSISYLVFAHKRAVLLANQRNDLLSNINSTLTVILKVIQIIVLFTIHNYYVYVILIPLFTLIENIMVNYISKKTFPQIYCEGNLDVETKKEIVVHVKGIALQKICSTSRNAFDSIVISAYLGLTTTAIYANYYFIMSAVHSFLYQIPEAIRSTVGNSIACEDEEKNYRLFKEMSLMYLWICGICASCLLCLFQPFMRVWMGKEMMFPIQTVILLVIYFFELSLTDIVALYKDGAGLWWHGRIRTVLEAASNLVLNILLGSIWGVDGVLIASNITLLLIGLGYGGYIVFHYYFKHEKYIKYLVKEGLYIVVTTISCAGAYGLCLMVPEMGLANIFINLIPAVGIPCLLFWIVFRSTEEFEDVKSRIPEILGIIKNWSGKR